MIDLDQMETQLAAALTPNAGRAPRADARPRPVPAPVPAPAPVSAPRERQRRRSAPVPASTKGRRPAPPPASGVRGLLELGLIEEVDAHIARATDRRDLATWATMRALFDGRKDAARIGIDSLVRMAGDGDAEALERSWLQRFWAAFEWGGDDERLDALDHCRDRAYRFDDLRWWGNLALLLGAMGKHDEGVRAIDAALPLVTGSPDVDVITNLVEAAALMGDAGRVAAAARHLRTPTGRLVVVGDGVVCKGSVDRYLGLIHAAAGQSADAGQWFHAAEATHRALGAEPLLARTLRQASGALVAAA